MNHYNYIYLHGFASSPQSLKAQYLSQQFAQKGISLAIPDLNQGDFANLTLTRQITLVSRKLPLISTIIIGSSLGGLTAAFLGEKYPQIEKLILLAPAFGFLPHWLNLLGKEQVKQWQETGSMPVYHYGEKTQRSLNYTFVEDTHQYQEEQLKRPIPTLIFHGKQDEVIPIDHSRNYATQRPWVTLIDLDSDHSLGNVLPQIWQGIQTFC